MASDVAALVRHTDQVVHLDDGEMAVLGPTPSAPSRSTPPHHKAPDHHQCERTAYDRPATSTTCTRRSTSSRPPWTQALRGRLDHRFATAHLGGIDLTPATCSACAG